MHYIRTPSSKPSIFRFKMFPVRWRSLTWQKMTGPTLSSTRLYMKVSDKLYAPATLPRRRESPHYIDNLPDYTVSWPRRRQSKSSQPWNRTDWLGGKVLDCSVRIWAGTTDILSEVFHSSPHFLRSIDEATTYRFQVFVIHVSSCHTILYRLDIKCVDK
jgi:hypothetical protein